MGFFSCKRGVRQGDPLSPLLFCLAKEVLSRGISKLVTLNKLSLNNGPSNSIHPSNALFVNDVLVFCKGTSGNLNNLVNLLNHYGSNLGQILNLHKCKFYSSPLSSARLCAIKSILRFQQGNFPFDCLGIPFLQGIP